MKLKIEIMGLCYYAIVRDKTVDGYTYNGLYALLLDPSKLTTSAGGEGGHEHHGHDGHIGQFGDHEHVSHVFINKKHDPKGGDDNGAYQKFPLKGFFKWLDEIQDEPRFTLPPLLTNLLSTGCYQFNDEYFKVGGPISAIIPLNFINGQSVISPVPFEFKNESGSSCDSGNQVYIPWKYVFEKEFAGSVGKIPIPGVSPQTLVPSDGDEIEIRIKNTMPSHANGRDPDSKDHGGDPKHFCALYELLTPIPCDKPHDCCYPDPIFTERKGWRFNVGGLYTCMGGGG